MPLSVAFVYLLKPLDSPLTPCTLGLAPRRLYVGLPQGLQT